MLVLFLLLSAVFSPGWQAIDPPWYTASRLPVTGEVTFYAPGVMEWAYEYRLRLNQVPVCDPPQCAGYVATLRPGDLGRTVWLKPAGQPAEGPFLVVDYAARKDFERLANRGLVAEVDFATAQRWGMSGPLHDVLILAESPYTERLHLPLVVASGNAAAQPPQTTTHSHSSSGRLWLPAIMHGTP